MSCDFTPVAHQGPGNGQIPGFLQFQFGRGGRQWHAAEEGRGGAHYNPNLTLGFYITGQSTAPKSMIYITIICTAAMCAQFLTELLGGLSHLEGGAGHTLSTSSM